MIHMKERKKLSRSRTLFKDDETISDYLVEKYNCLDDRPVHLEGFLSLRAGAAIFNLANNFLGIKNSRDKIRGYELFLERTRGDIYMSGRNEFRRCIEHELADEKVRYYGGKKELERSVA